MKRLLSICGAALFGLSACTPVSAQEPSAPPILVDQFGYLPSLNKRAVIKDPASRL